MVVSDDASEVAPLVSMYAVDVVVSTVHLTWSMKVTRVKLPVAMAERLPKMALAPATAGEGDRGITITLVAPTACVAVMVPSTRLWTSTWSPSSRTGGRC